MYQDKDVCDGRYRFYVNGEFYASAYRLNKTLCRIYEDTTNCGGKSEVAVYYNGQVVCSFDNRASLEEFVSELTYDNA